MNGDGVFALHAHKVEGSFRDPSGFVFMQEGAVFRQVNHCCQNDYNLLMTSGLYDELVEKELLVPHREVNNDQGLTREYYKIIQPRKIPFISFPYEWSFSQLKDAALATLTIQKIALSYGMSLKDSSAFNIQFWQGKPVLIDTLSFEHYREGEPWVAYRQFCQFFLAPLALMSQKNLSLGQLSMNFIEGIPIDLASDLLPWRSWLNLGLMLNIHLPRMIHRRNSKHDGKKGGNQRKEFSNKAFLGLLDNLYKTIEKMRLQLKQSEWSDYYVSDLYTSAYFDHKKRVVEQYLDCAEPQTVWDIGANTGLYSRACSARGISTIAFDLDPLCVERNYLEAKETKDGNLLPLWMDFTKPSPAIGWMNNERASLFERGPADLTLALAVIHHLAIGNNLPLAKIAQFFSRCANWAIVEFVPKNDPQTQKLLAFREDIFDDYTQQKFELEFSKFFQIVDSIALEDSCRRIYLLKAIK